MTMMDFKFLDVAQSHYMRALSVLFEDDHDAALQHLKISLKNLGDIGEPYSLALSELGVVHIFCETGRLDEAEIHVEKASKLIETINNDLLDLYLNLAKADLALLKGDCISLRSYLQLVLVTIHQRHNTPQYWVHTSVMERLCTKAIEMNIEVEIAHKLLEENRGFRPSHQTCADKLFTPICIYTLGRFSLTADGKPVQFMTKAQKKPMELLKVLIAYGGREVSEAMICDALWPDNEGDTAHRACATTLHRLRKLLGYDAAVQYHDAKLTLNPDFCWVDSWQFERLAGEAEGVNAEAIKGEKISSLEQAITLYHGMFLEAEQPQSWNLMMRERLRSKYLRVLQMLGQFYCRSGMSEWEITVYEKGLETDALAESIYHKLMLCYAGRGDVAKSLETYQRCRNMLGSILGIEPSYETRALYQNLRNGDIGKTNISCQDYRNKELSL